MRHAPSRSVLLFTALLVVGLPAQAQWKWRDGQGRVQYSDRPPPHSVPEKDVLQRPSARPLAPVPALPASSATAASAVPLRDPQIEARKQQSEQNEQAQRRDEDERLARQRKENCERAREYARTLESGMRIARLNAQGEREVLDDEQRQVETTKARDVMARECR